MTPSPSECPTRWPIFDTPVHALQGGELHVITGQLERTARRSGRCSVTALAVALHRVADAGGVLSLTLPVSPPGARRPFLVTAGALAQGEEAAWAVLDYQGNPLSLGRSAYDIADWLAGALRHGVRVDSTSGQPRPATLPPKGDVAPERWPGTDLWLAAWRSVRPRFLALLRARGGA